MEAQEPSEKEAKRRRANWGDGRIAFLALRAEIAGELDRKVPMSRIYAKHRLRLGISYRQFIRLVREFREQPRRAPAAAPVPLQEILPRHERASPDPENRRAAPAPAQPAASELQRARAPAVPETESTRDFHFDPTDAYRIKFD